MYHSLRDNYLCVSIIILYLFRQIGRGRRRSSSSSFPTVPVLLGELALHSDCVQVIDDNMIIT